MLEVKLLGQFDVRQDGTAVEIAARPAQALLAYLLLNRDTVFRREKLAGLLWPDTTEANARNNLRNALWRLRQALESARPPAGRDYFLADNLTLAFNPEAGLRVDVATLEAGEAGSATADDLVASISAYQGELLPGFYDEWVTLERERLQAIFEHKMDRLLEQLVAAARWPEVLQWAERWISLGSTPEPAYRALMIAHGEMGDMSRVAAVYARGGEALREQLGVEPSEQTRLVFDRLSKGGKQASGAPTTAPAAPAAIEEPSAPGTPPFKGLQHFEEADAAQFFGREQLTAGLLDRLRRQRFLAVVGASGSGKSSIVRAGLIPALRRQSEAAAPRWLVHLITPTAHPLEALAVSLTLDSESVTAAATLMDDLAHEPRSLHLAAQRLASRPGGGRLLLVVDQFEELFTLCRVEPERAAFLDNLLNAVEGDGPLAIVIALRADFYAHCAPYPRLRDALEKYQAYIGPMSPDELRRAIEEPATRQGWRFEPGLVDLLLQHVRDEPGALPLLSHALLETWQRRRGRTLTLGGYAESGGVGGAIAKTAQGVYEQMTPEQQTIARSIFLRLTELGEGTQDTRRRAARAELLSGPDGSAARQAATEAVLKTLADARLITLTQAAVEVAHEALIREWPTLREWLNENREALRLHRHLTEAAQAWDKLNRDPGELYRGARLARAWEWAEWSGTRSSDLNTLEREFLLASQALAEREAADREAQRQHELEAARALAEAQRQRAEAEKQRAEEQVRSSARLRTRNRILTAAGAVALALAIAAGFFGVQASRNAAEVERQAHLALSRELVVAATNLMSTQDSLAALLSVEALHLADTVEARSTLLSSLQEHLSVPHYLRGNKGVVTGVVFSPDGKTLASSGVGNTLILWDVATRQQIGLPLTGHTAPVLGVAFSPDGKMLASGSRDTTIILWDVATRQPIGLPLTGHTDPVLSVAFSPDGKTLVSGSRDGILILWDVATRQPIGKPLIEHTASVISVAFSPDGKTLASGSADKTILLWDAATRQPVGPPLAGHTGLVESVAFSPDGKTLASGSDDKTIRLWDVATRQNVGPSLTGHTSQVYSVAFSPDGETLASGSDDETIRLWDVATRQPVGPPLTGHTGQVYSVAFSPDGETLASGSYDTNIILWDLHLVARHRLAGRRGSVNSVAFSSDGKTLASGAYSGALVLWDVATRQPLGPPLTGHTGSINRLAFSPDGITVATGGDDRSLVLWDVATRQPLGPPLTGHTGSVTGVAFSPDGKTLASGSADNSIILWNVATRQTFGQPLKGHTDWVTSVAFSPDGKTLASGSRDGTLRLWDVATRQPQGAPLAAHIGGVTSVAFSPDGKTLVAGTYGGMLVLWDMATQQPLGPPLKGHGDEVLSVGFSVDGKTVASGSRDGTIRLWDAATRQPIGQSFTGHSGGVNSVAFSPDGNTLASGSNDTTILLWDVSVASWQARACAIAGRNLTQAEWAQYLPGQPYHKTCSQWPEGN